MNFRSINFVQSQKILIFALKFHLYGQFNSDSEYFHHSDEANGSPFFRSEEGE